MSFQHNHELQVKEKALLQNESIIKEINLYMDCQVPPATICQLLNRKFNIQTRSIDVYQVIKLIKSSFKESSDLDKSDLHEFLDSLHAMRDKDEDARFAYVMDTQSEKSLEEQLNYKKYNDCKLDRILV